jgi:hypothetical protein
VRVEEATLYTRPDEPPRVFGAALSEATAERAGAWELSLERDARRFPDRPKRWPLLVSAWKPKTR